MDSNVVKTEDQETNGRLWRFARCEFDEFSRALRVDGQPVELESKPLEVLYQLLLHAGEVVTKEELLEAAWPGVRVVVGSLPTAVSKLRKVLGDDDPPIIITLPRIGYRLAVPVQTKRLGPTTTALNFRSGDSVAGREQWRLVRRLDASESSEVWLTEHPQTGESRVFKFAADGVRLRALKREVTLARFLKEALGDRPDYARILEWNFETQPFYLESPYYGPNLLEWAEQRGGVGAVPFETRLHVLQEVIGAVAAAHEIGVLHKDLKPANVLIESKPEGLWQARVADFGSGALLDSSQLRDLGITNLGFTMTESLDARSITGTLMYMAPEVLAGQVPTASADIYALGVMLYQMAAGDFRKPLSPGWESDVEDPLLREDIAAAACGDPAKRLPSASLLAERLATLARRRIERNQLEQAAERVRIGERRLALTRARRPWVAAALATLAVGLGLSFALYQRAVIERDRANRETAITEAINRFLANDLLGRTDPFQSGKSAETLIDAVKQASTNIGRQFHDVPAVAARLHHAIARAFDNRSDFPDARPEYDRAAALYIQTSGPLSAEAAIVQLQRAAMEARSYEHDSLPLAKTMLAGAESRITRISHPPQELPVWLASARGMIALIENDAKQASAQFEKAYHGAEQLPQFDQTARLTLKQRLAFSYIRLGDGVKAERLFRELISAFSQLQGPDSPNVLRVRLNLAQALMIQNKHREAIEETSSIYPSYVARLGEEHELSMQVLTTQAQSEGSLGLWDDAIRDDLAIYRLAMKKQGPLSFFAIATLSDAALAQCRAGRLAEGDRNAAAAFTASTKAFGPRAGLTGGTAFTLATCHIGLGRLGEAAKLLKDIDIPTVAQLAGFPDWGANVDLARAEIAYREGDVPAARKYLESAGPVFSRPGAEPYQRRAMENLAASMDQRVAPGKPKSFPPRPTL
jgi:serine/threonine protein kinase/DNA-binding winged helix-turn-helix (wHTH) protein